MTTNKMKVRQTCLFVITFFLATKIIILPSVLAGYAKESLWISALINLIIDGAMLFFILKISDKFDGLSFFQILKENLGDLPTKIILFLYFIYFLLKAYSPIMEQKSFIEVALYETTHVVWIFAPIFLISTFFSYKGLKTVGRLADVLIWFTASAFSILISLSLPASKPSNLLPIIGIPIKSIFKGSWFTSLWYLDSTYILFLIGSFKRERLSKTKIMLSYGIFALAFILFLAVLYGEFGPLTKRQSFAPIKMGKYFLSVANSGRIDYVAGIALAIVCVFAVTLPLVFATLCLSHVFNFSHKIIPCIITNGIMATLFLTTQNYYFETFKIMQYFVVYFLVFMSYLLPLILIFFKQGRKAK